MDYCLDNPNDTALAAFEKLGNLLNLVQQQIEADSAVPER